MTDIRIRNVQGLYVVRAGGAVLGESESVLELSEGKLAPVLYFPRGDIAMAFLDRSETTTHCPHKGDASYFSIITKSKTIADVVWSYENPIENVSEIKEYLAFADSDEVAIEHL